MSNDNPTPGYGENPDPNYGGQPNYGGAPQPNYGAGPAGVKPDSNLVWGILVTLLCCLPLGIVSIIKATKVDSLWAQGDFAGAQQASEDAKKWAIYGIVGGVVVGVIYAIVVIAGVASM